MEKLLSIGELTEMLGVTKATIYSWTSQNKIPHIKLSKRLLKFREKEIMDWISKRSISADGSSVNKQDKHNSRSRPSSNLREDSIERIIRNAKEEILSTHMLEQFQSERIKKGNKPATVNRLLAVISHMFTKAVDWNMMDKGIVTAIRVKMLPENNKRLRYLSQEECTALVDACDVHLRLIVITALNTGCRKSEILGLRWDTHIDLKHGFILLDKTKNGERREIPINATLKAVLQGLNRRLDVPYVFFERTTGKPYKDVKRSFPSACKKAGIRDFSFHDLRHTFASHLVMAGIDLTTVKELLGHKEIKMTFRYAHLASSHKIKAMDILDRTLKGNCHDFVTLEKKGATPVCATP